MHDQGRRTLSLKDDISGIEAKLFTHSREPGC